MTTYPGGPRARVPRSRIVLVVVVVVEVVVIVNATRIPPGPVMCQRHLYQANWDYGGGLDKGKKVGSFVHYNLGPMNRRAVKICTT